MKASVCFESTWLQRQEATVVGSDRLCCAWCDSTLSIALLICRIPDDKPVSIECQHLIRSIFNPDPNTRITIPEILQHPWFVVGLPPQMFFSDWNHQVVQHNFDAKQRSEEIRRTVRAALMAGCPKPFHCVSDSAGSASGDMSDAEGANY